MKRKTVAAGLRACREIEMEIRKKNLLADESGDEKYRLAAAELRRVKQEIITCLNSLPTREFNTIWYHYIKGETWVRVAIRCHYSERQIRNIGKRALNRLADAFSKNPEIAAFCSRAESGTV